MDHSPVLKRQPHVRSRSKPSLPFRGSPLNSIPEDSCTESSSSANLASCSTRNFTPTSTIAIKRGSLTLPSLDVHIESYSGEDYLCRTPPRPAPSPPSSEPQSPVSPTGVAMSPLSPMAFSSPISPSQEQTMFSSPPTSPTTSSSACSESTYSQPSTPCTSDDESFVVEEVTEPLHIQKRSPSPLPCDEEEEASFYVQDLSSFIRFAAGSSSKRSSTLPVPQSDRAKRESMLPPALTRAATGGPNNQLDPCFPHAEKKLRRSAVIIPSYPPPPVPSKAPSPPSSPATSRGQGWHRSSLASSFYAPTTPPLSPISPLFEEGSSSSSEGPLTPVSTSRTITRSPSIPVIRAPPRSSLPADFQMDEGDEFELVWIDEEGQEPEGLKVVVEDVDEEPLASSASAVFTPVEDASGPFQFGFAISDEDAAGLEEYVNADEDMSQEQEEQEEQEGEIPFFLPHPLTPEHTGEFENGVWEAFMNSHEQPREWPESPKSSTSGHSSCESGEDTAVGSSSASSEDDHYPVLKSKFSTSTLGSQYDVQQKKGIKGKWKGGKLRLYLKRGSSLGGSAKSPTTATPTTGLFSPSATKTAFSPAPVPGSNPLGSAFGAWPSTPSKPSSPKKPHYYYHPNPSSPRTPSSPYSPRRPRRSNSSSSSASSAYAFSYISGSGSSDSDRCSCTSGASSSSEGLRRKPIPVEMFLRN